MSSSHSFQGENGDSYTFILDEDQVKLDCYLIGSIQGGTGTECNHAITGPKILEFFVQMGVKDANEIDERLLAYKAEDWRELHQVIIKHQTDSFVWSDTDWSDSIDLKVAIHGEARVGSRLTAIATATSTEGTFPVTYEWTSSDRIDGKYEQIESATDFTYMLAAVDRGKFIRVMASAVDAVGFNSSFNRSEAAGPVE